MLKHVVLFKFEDGVGEGQIEDLERLLSDLPGKIPEIRQYEFGRDVLKSERSYDFALVSAFDDAESMKRYQAHPEHLKVLDCLKKICANILAVDFEC